MSICNTTIKVPSTDIRMTAEELVKDAPANLSNLKTNWAQAYQVAGEMLSRTDDPSVSDALRKEARLLAQGALESLKYRCASEVRR